MADHTFGFAIVGGGVIAPLHAQAIAELPHAELRVVVDVNESAAQRQAAEFGVEAATDLAAVLARSDIDVVCVCVPSGLHAKIGVQVAEAGKHVVVEKPIDISLNAADRLIATCRRRGVKLTVISQHRFNPAVRQVREAVDAGRFGKLILGDAVVKWYRSQTYYEGADWRGTWELDGGGALINQGVHTIDLLQWMMGPVETVIAKTATSTHDIPVEDIGLAILTFANGALGLFEGSTAIYPGLPERLEISGTGGTAIVEGGKLTTWAFKDELGEVGTYGAKGAGAAHAEHVNAAIEPLSPHSTHRAQIADLLDAIRHDRDPAITGEDARRPLEIVLAIYESARTGEEVTLPLRR